MAVRLAQDYVTLGTLASCLAALRRAPHTPGTSGPCRRTSISKAAGRRVVRVFSKKTSSSRQKHRAPPVLLPPGRPDPGAGCSPGWVEGNVAQVPGLAGLHGEFLAHPPVA